jgi:hypothetical protein
MSDVNILDLSEDNTSRDQSKDKLPDPFDLINLEPANTPSPPPLASVDPVGQNPGY